MKTFIQISGSLLIFLIACESFSQEYQQYHKNEDFIETDSSKKVGIYFNKGTEAENAQFIVAKIRKEKVKFTPEDIKAYGFRNGQIYESHEVAIDGEMQKVFLEKLTEGKYSLYYYSDESFILFFIYHNNEWIKLKNDNEENFRQTLDKIKDCEKLNEAIQLVTFTKKSLSRLIQLFDTCKKIPFPYAKYGVNVSLVRADMDARGSDNFENRPGEFNSNYSLSAGIFADLPIEVTQFSFYIGFNLQYNQFNYQQEGSIQNLDLKVNILTAELPIQIRYAIPVAKFRPYVFAGTSLAYNFINGYDIEDRLFPDYDYRENLVSDFMFGLGGGVGLQIQRRFDKAILLEFKYQSRNGTANTMDMSQLSFGVSYEL